jgi:F0F1-type ATP synthase assembly protein I
MFDFPWWVWLLIVIGLIAMNLVKLKVFKSIGKKKQNASIDKED